MRKIVCRLRLNEVSRQQRRRPEPPPDASCTIPRIGSIKLTKLTAHDLQKLYKELMESGRTRGKSGHGNPGLSSTTVRSLHLMLHNALNRAVKERLILRNPTEPNAGSDASKSQTQTRLAGDHYVINDSKIFSSRTAPKRACSSSSP